MRVFSERLELLEKLDGDHYKRRQRQKPVRKQQQQQRQGRQRRQQEQQQQPVQDDSRPRQRRRPASSSPSPSRSSSSRRRGALSRLLSSSHVGSGGVNARSKRSSCPWLEEDDSVTSPPPPPDASPLVPSASTPASRFAKEKEKQQQERDRDEAMLSRTRSWRNRHNSHEEQENTVALIPWCASYDTADSTTDASSMDADSRFLGEEDDENDDDAEDMLRITTIQWIDRKKGLPLETIHWIPSFEDEEQATCRVVIILTNETATQFEFLHCEYDTQQRLAVSDVLSQLGTLSNKEHFQSCRFVALCTQTVEMINRLSLQDYHLRDGDLLWAVCKGNTSKHVLQVAQKLIGHRALYKSIRKLRICGCALQILQCSNNSSRRRVTKKKQQEEEQEVGTHLQIRQEDKQLKPRSHKKGANKEHAKKTQEKEQEQRSVQDYRALFANKLEEQASMEASGDDEPEREDERQRLGIHSLCSDLESPIGARFQPATTTEIHAAGVGVDYVDSDDIETDDLEESILMEARQGMTEGSSRASLALLSRTWSDDEQDLLDYEKDALFQFNQQDEEGDEADAAAAVVTLDDSGGGSKRPDGRDTTTTDKPWQQKNFDKSFEKKHSFVYQQEKETGIASVSSLHTSPSTAKQRKSKKSLIALPSKPKMLRRLQKFQKKDLKIRHPTLPSVLKTHGSQDNHPSCSSVAAPTTITTTSSTVSNNTTSQGRISQQRADATTTALSNHKNPHNKAFGFAKSGFMAVAFWMVYHSMS